jgi:hypothetical protein
MVLGRLLVIIACSAPGWSSVVYTNIGAMDVYTSSYTVYSGQLVAAQFSPTESGPLGAITMQLERTGFGVPPGLSISLRGPGSGPDGAVLEVWALAPSDVSPPPGSPQTLQSILHPVLSAGSTYWLRAESSAPFPFAAYGWAQNVTGDLGTAVVSLDGGASWAAAGRNPAFEVTTVATAAIPEPASEALLTLGLLAMLLRRALLRRCGCRGDRQRELALQ